MTLSPDQRNYMAFQSPERGGDRAILRGDFALANKEFERVYRNNRLPYDRKGRTIAKQIALPMYELEWRHKISEPIDEELQSRVEACHADAAELLNVCLQDIRRIRMHSQSPSNSSANLGLISELTIYTLGARRFNRKGDFYFLPTSTDQNFAGPFAADLRLVAADQRGKSASVQVKTSERARRQYSRAVSIVTVQNLDPLHYATPEHPDSLASSLTREIAGTADTETLSKLDEIEERLFDTLGRYFDSNTNYVVS